MRADHRRTRARALPALIAIAGAAIAGCGSASPEPANVRVESPPAATALAQPTSLARADTEPAPPQRLTLRTPPGASPVIWVKAGEEAEMRTEPGGGELVKRIGRRSVFGSPSVFGVVKRHGNWAGVTTRLLPNNQLAWIKLDPARIAYGWTRYAITVDISERRAALTRGDHVELTFPVTVGAPGSDTPSGRFAVTDTFTGLDSAAYGCCALALSATQSSLPSGWLGGNTIAIHGTAGPLGVAASHGCVRAADPTVARLVRTVPLGTPVFIRA